MSEVEKKVLRSDSALSVTNDDHDSQQEVSSQHSRSMKETTMCLNPTCSQMLPFLKGIVSFRCEACNSVNCFDCKKLHPISGSGCPIDIPPANIRKGSSDANPMRATRKRTQDMSMNSTGNSNRSTSEETESSEDNEAEEEEQKHAQPKRLKLEDVVFESTLTTDVLFCCRLCSYETKNKYSFKKHQLSKKHSTAMKFFKKHGKVPESPKA